VALTGGATLLMSAALWAYCPVAGLVFDVGLIALDCVSALSGSLWQTLGKVKDANTTENMAYVTAPAAGTEGLKGTTSSDLPVDAVLGSTIYWIFTDNNIESHSLDITVELVYYTFDYAEERMISTSVHLDISPDAGNNINNARHVTTGEYLAYVDDWKDLDDYYYYDVTVPANKYVHVIMIPLLGDANFDLYLYNADGYLLKFSNKLGNATEEIWYVSSLPRNYYIRVNAVVGRGLYTLKIEITDTGPPASPKVVAQHYLFGTDRNTL
jgi:hypothetical protein